jgi:uncharacterized protein YbjT (DUF2867 family)
MFGRHTDRTLEVGGSEALTFNELVLAIARVAGRRVRLLHIPVGAALAVTRSFESLRLPFPITSEQVAHVDEDLPADVTRAQELFAVPLASFEDHLRRDYA